MQKQPGGKILSFNYKHSKNELKDVVISVHYALYDNIPLIKK